MSIQFKIKGFPQVSETFVVNSIVYAKRKGYKINIYVDKYLGLENSSQSDLLKKYNIEKDVVRPFKFSQNKFKKALQVLGILFNPKVILYLIPYYRLQRKKNLSPLATLYQYRNFKDGIVHVHFNNALHPLVELSKIGYINPKCIISFHGYDAYLDNKEIFQKKYSHFYKKHVVAVTILSKHLSKRVINLGVDKKLIHIINLGIDVNFFKSKPKQLKSNKIKMLSVGRLVQWKGHTYGLKAVKQLIDEGYDVSYTIIGAGVLDNELKEETNKLGLDDYIDFKGALSQIEVFNAMKFNDIFLLPSTFDDIVGRRETFGLVSVEAQAMGLPVVGFNSGGFPETLLEGKTGFTVEDRNIDQLASKIKYLIDNPDLYASMSQEAIKHAQNFDHKHTTQQYLDLYKKISLTN